MAKKRRQKVTVYAVLEGEKRENIFFKYLQSVYQDNGKVNITISPKHGGNADYLVTEAIKNRHFDISFAWID